MKLTVDHAALVKTLSHIQGIVERRNTIPILSNVLIRASQGRIAFTATDMDLEVNELIEGEVARTGEVTVAAHMLYDIVRKLPESRIEIEKAEHAAQITLRAGRSNFKLGTLPVEDYPQMKESDLTHSFTLPAADLSRMIDRTKFAMSTEENRYYLNGIFLHVATGKSGNAEQSVLRAVATDGHRLARVETPAPAGSIGIPGVIVPRKAVNELRKLLDESGDDITIQMSQNKIRFSFGNTVLTSKLIDGTFPDYERVIPANNDKILEVDTKSFARAVDRVATISTEKSRAIKLAAANGNLSLSANSPEAGSAAEEIEVTYDAAQIEIGFNARYLLDIAQQIGGDRAKFTMADAGSPTIVQDIGDPDSLFVLMPIRV